jgi:hypothetical protein
MRQTGALLVPQWLPAAAAPCRLAHCLLGLGLLDLGLFDLGLLDLKAHCYYVPRHTSWRSRVGVDREKFNTLSSFNVLHSI